MSDRTMAAIRTVGAIASPVISVLSLIIQLYGLHYIMTHSR